MGSKASAKFEKRADKKKVGEFGLFFFKGPSKSIRELIKPTPISRFRFFELPSFTFISITDERRPPKRAGNDDL